jgi:branched-chain amino acid transport system ATP-binding protein
MLQVDGLRAGYAGSTVLDGIGFSSGSGITLVIGPNGAGKTTLVRSIVGTLRPIEGSVRFEGEPIERLRADQVARLGIVTVPERARLFGELRVVDNLRLGSRLAEQRDGSVDFQQDLASVLELFPDLGPKLNSPARLLSGGQQQMVAIARALVAHPKLLVMDEPTTGLHPTLIQHLLVRVEQVARDLPILLTEQNVLQTVPLATQVYLLEAGRIVLAGRPAEILANDQVRRTYLGQRPEDTPTGVPGAG